MSERGSYGVDDVLINPVVYCSSPLQRNLGDLCQLDSVLGLKVCEGLDHHSHKLGASSCRLGGRNELQDEDERRGGNDANLSKNAPNDGA
jgi:hypothetical protein